MLFNSYIFIFLFLPLVLVGYYGLNYFKLYKIALAFVIGMSMWFYGYNSVQYLFILIVSILLNYLLVEGMLRVGMAGRRVFLTAGLLLNLGILFYYKYYDFFIENVNALWKTDMPMLEVMLPLGISFYTFQQLSYVIDYYRGECEKYSLLEYAAYVSFFPQLIAGPIVYHDELIPQLRDTSKKKLDAVNLSKGIYAFTLGLAKKVLVADTFSKLVTIGYDNIESLNTPSALLVMLAYTLQIYFDFSGYCDMAYGLGYLFNIELPVNFNSPYKADSISDFWARWHLTLTRFFTKYVYIPLGGSRKGTFCRYRNILIIFLTSGIWHGANWTFILWGLIQGVANVIDKIIGKWWRKLPWVLRVGVTFCFVNFTMSLFRADSVAQAGALWAQLVHGGWGAVYEPLTETFYDLTELRLLYRIGFAGIIDAQPWLILSIFTLVMLAVCFTMRNTQEKTTEMRYTNRRIVAITLLFVWSVMSLSDVSEFLYYNF